MEAGEPVAKLTREVVYAERTYGHRIVTCIRTADTARHQCLEICARMTVRVACVISRYVSYTIDHVASLGHAPQWLHFLERENNTLNSLSHFLHDGSLSLYSGGGPLSRGIPPVAIVEPGLAWRSAGGAEAR